MPSAFHFSFRKTKKAKLENIHFSVFTFQNSEPKSQNSIFTIISKNLKFANDVTIIDSYGVIICRMDFSAIRFSLFISQKQKVKTRKYSLFTFRFFKTQNRKLKITTFRFSLFKTQNRTAKTIFFNCQKNY